MANVKLRVGLVGLGFIGKVHAQAYRSIPFCYQSPTVGVKIAAILRTKTGSDLDLLESLGNPFVTTDVDKFYRQNLDMVDICTPNFLHLEQAQDALAHKHHLYIEKPLGWNLAHARRIASAAEKAGVLTHTAFMKRYFPSVRQAKAIIASGLIGEIYNFNVHYYHNSYMDPQRPISWRLQQTLSGGGAFADLGVHIIDLVRYILGEADWVQCHTRTFINKRPSTPDSSEFINVDVDDWALCTVGMQNGAIGTIEATRMSGGLSDSNRMEIFGSCGSVVVDMKDPLHCRYYDQNTKQHHIGNLDIALPTGERDTSGFWPTAKMSLGPFVDAHTACIFDFLHCIKEGKQSMTNFTDAVKTQEILEAAYTSAKQEATIIKIPLE